MSTKDDYIKIRVKVEFKKIVKAAAEKDNRDMSNYVINLIKEDLKKKGFLCD